MPTRRFVTIVSTWLIGMSVVLLFMAPGESNASTSQASFRLLPQEILTSKGAVFQLSIEVETHGRSVNGLDACISYPPNLLQVRDSDSSKSGVQVESDTAAFDLVLANGVDISNGVVNYSAGRLGAGLASATFTVAKIEFEAIDTSSGAMVSFSDSGCPATPNNIISGPDSVLGATFGSKFVIVRNSGEVPPVPTTTGIGLAIIGTILLMLLLWRQYRISRAPP